MPSGRAQIRLSAAVIAGLALACTALGFDGSRPAAEVWSYECGRSLAPATDDSPQPALHQSHGTPTGGAGWRTSSNPALAVLPTTDGRPRPAVAVGGLVVHPTLPSLPVRVLFGVWLN